MRNSQNFWDKNAGRYDRFMRKDAAAYERLYELLRPVVRHKTVLELATGTGLIAKNIVRSADHIEATDASQEMIEQAKQGVKSTKLYFSVQDMFHLPYADESFDVVIVANALHIVPEPEKALPEIRRVLKDDGVLVAPTFTHADNAFFGTAKAFFMKLAGFPLHSKWTSADYLSFLRENGWTVKKHRAENLVPADLRRVREIGGVSHADIGTRAGAGADAAVFPLHGRACMGFCRHDHAAFSEMACFSGGV